MNTQNKIELIEETLLESVSGGVADRDLCEIDLCSIDICDWPCFFD